MDVKGILSKISPDKRNRILNSAFEEFAKAGFERASTNEIVEKAGISKGLLFHYFGSKQQLYQLLIEFSYSYVTELLNQGIDWNQRDFFQRAEEITTLKLSAMQNYPHIYDFLWKATENLSMEDIKNRFPADLAEINTRVYTENIDYSLFRRDIDLDKTIEIIQWTVERATEKVWKNASTDMEIGNAIKEHREYMKILRTLVYQSDGRDQL